MARIEINFDEVPDKVMPVDPGVYTLLVEEAEIKPTKDGKSQIVGVKLKINDEGSPNYGRLVFDHISLKMATNLKRLWKSAGFKPGAGGVDVEEIIGKVVRARIKNRAYKGDDGQMQETSAVQEYLFEGSD